MRVYPPVYLLGRESREPMEVAGYPVPRGTSLFMAQWVVHRSHKWFADPLEFRSERWLDGLAKRLPRYAYFPFGGGPRVCIGEAFARLEAALILATVGRRYRFTWDGGPPVDITPSITLLPTGGLPATLRRR